MAQLTLSLKGRALRLLSGREYARQELARKLAPFEEAPGSLAVVLDDLQAKGFICEQRVLESVIHRRATKLGAARIQQELQAKGIDTEQIALAVAGLRGTELMRAHAIWQKKFGFTAGDTRSRAQQARFLAARGFDGDTIRRVLSLDEGELTGPASI
jgi:regulatory protein